MENCRVESEQEGARLWAYGVKIGSGSTSVKARMSPGPEDFGQPGKVPGKIKAQAGICRLGQIRNQGSITRTRKSLLIRFPDTRIAVIISCRLQFERLRGKLNLRDLEAIDCPEDFWLPFNPGLKVNGQKIILIP